MRSGCVPVAASDDGLRAAWRVQQAMLELASSCVRERAGCQSYRTVSISTFVYNRLKSHGGKGAFISRTRGLVAASGAAGVSLLRSLPLQQLGAVQAPAALRFSGIVRGGSVVSLTGTRQIPTILGARPITLPRGLRKRQRHQLHLHRLTCTGQDAGLVQS